MCQRPNGTVMYVRESGGPPAPSGLGRVVGRRLREESDGLPSPELRSCHATLARGGEMKSSRQRDHLIEAERNTRKRAVLFSGGIKRSI
jgi:hypothetical protein